MLEFKRHVVGLLWSCNRNGVLLGREGGVKEYAFGWSRGRGDPGETGFEEVAFRTEAVTNEDDEIIVENSWDAAPERCGPSRALKFSACVSKEVIITSGSRVGPCRSSTTAVDMVSCTLAVSNLCCRQERC